MFLLNKITSILVAPFLAISALFTPVNVTPILNDELAVVRLQEKVDSLEAKLGASFIDKQSVVAFFETSLATPLTASGTTMTLVSATDKQGTTLASSTYGFIIDEGLASEEIVMADCTGTSCANLERGLDPRTATTSVYALIKAHARGASVKITDAPKLLQLSLYANGQAGFPAPLRLKTGQVLCADDTCLATRKYVNDTSVAGASDALYATKGIVTLGTAAQASSSAATGPTSAAPVVPTSIVSGISIGTTSVVATKLDGTIHRSYIATGTGESYHWGASTTFSGSPIQITGSSTAIGTKDFDIGGQNLWWELDTSVASGSALVLANPGNGTLRFQPVPQLDWVRLDQTVTSGAQSTATVSSLSARRRLMIMLYAPSVSSNGNVAVRFNCCDSSYTWMNAFATTTGRDHHEQGRNSIQLNPVTSVGQHYYTLFVSNETGGNQLIDWSGSVVGTLEYPRNVSGAGRYASSSVSQITEVNFVANDKNYGNSGTETFGSGAVISVWGSRD